MKNSKAKLLGTILSIGFILTACGKDEAPQTKEANVIELGDSSLRHVNVRNGATAVQGYDVVSYHQGVATKGDSRHTTTHEGVKYLFSSAANKDLFSSNPTRYRPAYGGWCATAMAMDVKIDINPEKFKITDGRLYLFSNVNGQDALVMWNQDETTNLRNADLNWNRRVKDKGQLKHQNLTEDRIAVQGYDLVSYRDGKPVVGSETLSVKFRGAIYRFVSEKNRKKFLADADAFLPEYGGWCATAMAMKGALVGILPTKYEIEDGRLYLFSFQDGADAQKMWNDRGGLEDDADLYWERYIR